MAEPSATYSEDGTAKGTLDLMAEESCVCPEPINVEDPQTQTTKVDHEEPKQAEPIRE